MKIVRDIDELKQAVAGLKAGGRRVAFVPTMGNLHVGHLRLVEEAGRLADAVVASIYVNPTQFGPNEDFAAYPRTPEEDRRRLEEAGLALLFMPDDAAVYPRGMEAHTRVEVPGISDILCGAARPGHFRGVATVVSRLLNLVGPDVAVFGKKDYQQLLVIRLMVADLAIPVEIVGVDTVREADGLACSSRNAYLTPAEREIAPRLYAILLQLRARILDAGGPSAAIGKEGFDALARAGLAPEYVSVRRQQDLAEAGPGDRDLVILAAARLGRARLIDNLEVRVNSEA
jgi:pantoate--beta-alanine ligase